MIAKKPSAIVYGWPVLGTSVLKSDIYFEENLFDDVILHSIPYNNNVFDDYSKYKPDVIISINTDIEIYDWYLKSLHFSYNYTVPGNILANDIVAQSTFRNCSPLLPRFSVFTCTYETSLNQIERAYKSLLSQKISDWEWVVVDDSITTSCWDKLEEISRSDYRVKVHRILPQTQGNIGLAKRRAASLCQGEWILELDHDDELLSDCLLDCFTASQIYKEAGFIYSDCSEVYDNGKFKSYDSDFSGNWYGRPGNTYCWGYAGHSWVEADGRKLLAHHTPDINPRTIRFNIGMPNHLRAWKRTLYQKINGHNPKFPVADDFELIVRTFLETRMIHIKKVLYVQYSDRNTTTDNNSIDINRRSRLIRDYYNKRINQRIKDLGGVDWDWDSSSEESPRTQNESFEKLKFGVDECYLNYIYVPQKV
jgi:glycosyltransferase involved in cell wall biosynthesis